MRSRKRFELHLYWDDGVTIEVRYFETREEAESYALESGMAYIIYDLKLAEERMVGRG